MNFTSPPRLLLFAFVSSAAFSFADAAENTWPPPLRGAVKGTVTLQTPDFLRVPDSVAEKLKAGKIVAFDVAKVAPKVELAFHDQLGPDAAQRRLWSSWGDIAVASDGRVYCGIGDHGEDAGGDARCFVYRWEPRSSELRQIVDMNRVIAPRAGQVAWSKIHAKIDEAADGKIFFSCTLNASGKAGDARYGFNDTLPGGQLYRLDPATDRVEVFANLPPRRCTATSLLDRARGIWWCNLEAGGGDALWGFDLATRKVVHQGADGSAGFNRAFALLHNGQIIINGNGAFQRLDPATGKLTATKASHEGSPGMRCATRESRDGNIFGVLQGTHEIFRYNAARDELQRLGPTWLAGEYTTVCELSPDERFLYFLPGAHGRAWESGTPVIQFDLATGRRKVLAFLASPFESAHDYVPAGTYGMKLSTDGSTIFVNFNGHAADKTRPAGMKTKGFGLTAFAAIHIPREER
jgi:hypothetical protein